MSHPQADTTHRCILFSYRNGFHIWISVYLVIWGVVEKAVHQHTLSPFKIKQCHEQTLALSDSGMYSWNQVSPLDLSQSGRRDENSWSETLKNWPCLLYTISVPSARVLNDKNRASVAEVYLKLFTITTETTGCKLQTRFQKRWVRVKSGSGEIPTQWNRNPFTGKKVIS